MAKKRTEKAYKYFLQSSRNGLESRNHLFKEYEVSLLDKFCVHVQNIIRGFSVFLNTRGRELERKAGKY